MLDCKLVTWKDSLLPKILQDKGLLVGTAGKLPYIKGFIEYNNIVKINSVFSSDPKCMPVDRTLSTRMPFKYYVPRPWQIPTHSWTLDTAMEQRVYRLLDTKKRINLMWSGGIDSTALVTAFLKHAGNREQLRLLYSPWSTYEHPEYIKFLKKFNNLELVDVSGTRYMNWDFDGMFVTGDGGDELLSSVDESFIDSHGINKLHDPWIDFFYNKTNDSELVEFCQRHFALAGRPIETILQARWWFYTCFKSRSILTKKILMLFDRPQIDVDDLQGFYDCNEFENYIYWNIENCINDSYSSWKQILKDYAHKFDGLENWHQNKIKNHSSQMYYYWSKKEALTDKRWIAVDSNGVVSTTPSLPILTKAEYDKYTNLNWAFN